ncbi:MAG: histidinol dehydrogenase, partial [Spirochaetota bacterium]
MKHIVYSGLSEARRAALLRRPAAKEQEAIARRVAALEGEILQEGDAALRRFARQFDGVDLQPLQFAVERPVWQTAWEHLPAELQTALQTALRNIAKFHRSELPRRREAVVETTAGVHCWREFRAIDTVGLYIPGGSAPLFSTMLMLGIPAIIAGCREIIFCSPPLSAAGKPYAPKKGIYAAEEMLACMELLYRFSAEAANSQELPSVPRLRYFQLGGAGAIFALAYGKEAGCSVPAAAKIFGPGNAYVTEAKLRISRRVAIDMPAGPSEVLVIADDAARPQVVAADLLAQAEHGPNSQVILASPSAALLGKVEAEVARQTAPMPRSQKKKGTI